MFDLQVEPHQLEIPNKYIFHSYFYDQIFQLLLKERNLIEEVIALTRKLPSKIQDLVFLLQTNYYHYQ